MHIIGLDIGGSKSHAVSWRRDSPGAEQTVEAALRKALGQALAVHGLTDLRVLDREPAHGALALAHEQLTSTLQGDLP